MGHRKKDGYYNVFSTFPNNNQLVNFQKDGENNAVQVDDKGFFVQTLQYFDANLSLLTFCEKMLLKCAMYTSHTA